MRFYWLIVGTLGVWRITHLLAAEDGPWDVMVRLRRRAGSRFFGKLLDCFYCLSLWIAAPLAILLGENYVERLLLWPALSGAAILLERATASTPAPTVYYKEEEKEESDVLLRQESNGDDGQKHPQL